MIKSLELSSPNSCINKAADNEPVFVLRAHDMCAPEAVRYWAYLAAGGPPINFAVNPVPQLVNLSDHLVEKLKGAFMSARAMEAWPDRKMPD